MEFADPVIDIAVEPKTKAEQDKMGIALQKLAEEDPTFRVSTNHETGQTIIAGMGELHLEIIVDRLLREFKVEANVGKPQVAYRERPGHEVMNAEGKFVRQSGGRGQYGHAVINMYPQEPGKGYEFVNKIVGGVVPKEYIPSIDKGIQEALNSGVLAGYPVEDVKVELIDGSYHDVDSSEAAFKVAGSMAIKDALRKSNPVILEPVMAVEVETPEEYTGFVMGDIPSRRGHDPGPGAAWQRRRHRGQGAAGQDVRLRDRPAFRYAGPRRVHHADATPTSRCPKSVAGRDHQQGRRQRVAARPSEKLLFGGNVSG